MPSDDWLRLEFHRVEIEDEGVGDVVLELVMEDPNSATFRIERHGGTMIELAEDSFRIPISALSKFMSVAAEFEMVVMNSPEYRKATMERVQRRADDAE